MFTQLSKSVSSLVWDPRISFQHFFNEVLSFKNFWTQVYLLLLKNILIQRYFQFSQLETDTKTKTVMTVLTLFYSKHQHFCFFSLWPISTKSILKLNCEVSKILIMLLQSMCCKTRRKIQFFVYPEYALLVLFNLTYGVASLLSFYQNCISTKEL